MTDDEAREYAEAQMPTQQEQHDSFAEARKRNWEKGLTSDAPGLDALFANADKVNALNAARGTEARQQNEDTARLDWIESRGANGCLLEIGCDKFTHKWAIGVNNAIHDTARAAIDAARRQP